MTCIAAIRTTDSILMGGDSAESNGNLVRIISSPKVFLKADYILGATSSSFVAQVLQYEFNPPTKRREMGWHTFMVRVFVEKLKEQTKLSGLGDSARLLVGTKGGGIFEIAADFTVCQSIDGFAAVGRGGSYALGSLYSTSGDPRSRLKSALEAAAYFDAFVRPPFTVLELPEEGLHEEWGGEFSPMEDRSRIYEVDRDDHGGEDEEGREI